MIEITVFCVRRRLQGIQRVELGPLGRKAIGESGVKALVWTFLCSITEQAKMASKKSTPTLLVDQVEDLEALRADVARFGCLRARSKPGENHVLLVFKSVKQARSAYLALKGAYNVSKPLFPLNEELYANMV